MPDDDMDGPWVTDWDEIDGVVDEDDELLEDEYFDDEYIDEPPARPARTVPLAADRYIEDDGYDDGYADDGEGGRRRRALAVVAGALLFVLLGAAAAALLVNQDGDDVETDAASSSSSSSTTRTTPSSLGALPGQVPAPGVSSTVPSGSSSTSTTKATTSTTKAVVTTTTEAPDGPACSPTGTTKSPEAGNLPMKVAFCIDDPTPKVGQVVTVSGTAEDLDGGVTVDCVKVSWQGEEFGECFPPQADPPASSNESYSFQHTFTQPGTYTIHVGAQSGKPEPSFAETTLKITVHA